MLTHVHLVHLGKLLYSLERGALDNMEKTVLCDNTHKEEVVM